MKFVTFMMLSSVALVAAKDDGSEEVHKLRIHVAQPKSADLDTEKTDFDYGFLRGGGSSSADSNCNEISSKSKREDCKSRKKSNRSSSGGSNSRSSGSSSRDSNCNEISSKSKREDCKRRKRTSSSSDFVRVE